MSFADCIRRSDIGIGEQDVTAIQSLIDSGMSEVDAVKTHLQALSVDKSYAQNKDRLKDLDIGKQDLEALAFHPEMHQAQREVDERPATDPEAPERQEMQAKIAEELYQERHSEHEVAAERKVWLVLGPPASGKSSLVESGDGNLEMAKKLKAMIIDSDDAKARIPEFDGGLGANAVHQESKRIATQILSRAIDEEQNIVEPLVGANYQNLLAKIEKYERLGYTVGVRLVDLDIEETFRRSIARFVQTGRFISPEYIFETVGYGPAENYLRLIKEGIVNDYEAFSSNVPKGQQLSRIENPETELSGRSVQPVRPGPRSIHGSGGGRNTQTKSRKEKGTKNLKDESRGNAYFVGFQSIIKLTEHSNLSTFLHEAGHLFLETEAKLSDLYGSPGEQQALFKWLGIESFDDLDVTQYEDQEDSGLSDTEWKAHRSRQDKAIQAHEQFARGFEAYLREGKAPSIELRNIFATFRQWLIRLYESIKSLDVEINDDIRQYMDRLLATDEEIERAYANPAYDQYFRSKEQAGMSDKEWEAHQKRQEKAKTKATETIDQKLLKELHERRSKEWQEEKAPLIEEEKDRLSKEPVYQLMSDLKSEPMDYDDLKEIMGWEKQPGKLIGKAKKGGIDPQEYAEVYGYRSVQSMVEELLETETLKKAAEAAAEERMVGKYGDILNDGSIEEEVRQAVHNEEQAKVLLDEIRALNKQSNNKREIDRGYLKAHVLNIVSQMKAADLKPAKYYYAEIRAAKRAVTATDPQDQLDAKVQQIINHYLYKEITAAKQNLEKWRRYIRKVQTKEYKISEVAPGYIQNMKALANLYEVRRKPGTEEEKQKRAANKASEIDALLTWFTTQMSDENQLIELQLLDLNLLKALEAKENDSLSGYAPPTYEEMTIEELESVYQTLRHLRFVGGKMSDEQRVRRTKDAGDLATSIDDNGIRKQKNTRGVPRKGEGERRSASEWLYSIVSLRNLMRTLDGFQDGEGQAIKKIYRTIEDANSEKLKVSREVYDRLIAEVGDISKIGLNRNTKDYRVSDGRTLAVHPESRFMMALYWGTESSREAIREGIGVTDQDVEMILADLTADQLKMVNAVWKLNESLWPDLSSASVMQYGVAPPKLDATPFEVKGVKMTGGHMRLFYDSTRTEMKKTQEEGGRKGSVMPGKAGSLHARIGSGGRPPLLDIHNITRSLDENIHFIAFSEPAAYIRSLVNNDGIRTSIESHYGPGFYEAMIKNIDHITSGRSDQEASSFLAKLGRLTRQAATFKHLAYSVRNTVQQASALPIAMKEVGNQAFTKNFLKFANPSSHDEMVDFITSNSEFMKNRTSLVNREAAEFLKTVITTSEAGKAWEIFKAAGFTPQTFMDSLLAYPVWAAKYEQSINSHGDHDRAVSEADTSVSESVGSGSDLHLGGLFQQANNQWVKTFTVFGTWFNAYYQRIYRSTKGGTDYLNREALSALITMPMIVGTLSALLVADVPGDEEDWYTWALKRYGAFLAGTMPLIREMASAFSGFSPKTLIGGGQESLPRIISEVESFAEGKQSGLKMASDITKMATTIVPVPGIGNVIRVMDYVDSYSKGKEGDFDPYQMFVEGPNRNR
ncbi:MAG: zeta toxin family protein [Candidatus Thiodiazotropha lotti]|nr:zeta toxin family protein [Candidatus Thiodiazotropha lotti]